MTYGELQQYINSASRDEYGYHETKDNCLHIYSGCRQVNICIGKPNYVIGPIPIANVIFNVEPDGATRVVSLIPVINGESQYHSTTRHTLEEEVGGYYGLVLDSITSPINTV